LTRICARLATDLGGINWTVKSMVEKLIESGMFDDTYVVFASDNGYIH
jgi:arylsulfatase A-like enzyme